MTSAPPSAPATHAMADVRAHLLARIAAAPGRRAPFPFILADDALPAASYDALLAALPSADAMPTLVATGRVSPTYSPRRRVLELNPDALAVLPPAERALWTGLADTILGQEMIDALVARFHDDITARFPQGMRTRADAVYCEDAARYALDPHTDGPMKLLTAIFYLPAAAGQEHLGTALYEPLDPTFRCAGGLHRDRRRFRLVGTVPYRPNTMFAFLKSDRSFHGVEPVPDSDLLRRVLILNIFAKPKRPPAGR